MVGKISRSFRLVKESYHLLKQDKELVWFPIFSGIATFFLFLSFIIPLVVLAFITGIEPKITPLFYLLFFIYYLLSFFIVIFFNTALIACAEIRLKGGDPQVRDGLRIAYSHFGRIFLWSLISATIGTIFRIILDQIDDKFGPLGELVGHLFIAILGTAWTLLTFFVVPVMIFENQNIFASIKRSGQLFKKTWGENLIGQFSIGLVFFLLALPVIGIIILAFLTGSLWFGFIVLILGILYFLGLGILSSSLNGIFVAALYHYASTGKVPRAFSPDLVKEAFKQKTKRKYFGLLKNKV